MKTKIVLFLLLLFCVSIQSQIRRHDSYGKTELADSQGVGANWYKITKSNVEVAESLKVNKTLTVLKEIYIDTNQTFKIAADGFNMVMENTKPFGTASLKSYTVNLSSGNDAYYNFDSTGGHFRFVVGAFQFPIDFTRDGINLMAGMSYMIDGTPITGGSGANLYGYLSKDSSNLITAVQRFFEGFRIVKASDSVSFSQTSGNLIVNPSGNSVTFGSTSLTGADSVYAGEYFRGTQSLKDYFNTVATLSNVIHTTTSETKSSGNLTVSDTIKTKGLQGTSGNLIIQDVGGLNRLTLFNSGSSGLIQLKAYNDDNAALLISNSSYMQFGDGGNGKPLMFSFGNNLTAPAYSFSGDGNTGIVWRGADSISFVTNGTARTTIGATTITDFKPRYMPALYLDEQSSMPINLSRDNQASIYVKTDKLIVAFNLGGTMHYYYIDLTSAANQQLVYSATEP